MTFCTELYLCFSVYVFVYNLPMKVSKLYKPYNLYVFCMRVSFVNICVCVFVYERVPSCVNMITKGFKNITKNYSINTTVHECMYT